jgi:hypothetical protein
MKPRFLFIPLIAAVLAVPSLAFAGLGEDVSSIQADQMHMKGTARVLRSELNYTVKEMQMPSGTLVREYVASNGIIFGVAWNGPTMPDLHQLMGQYTVNKSAVRTGPISHSHYELHQDDWVVHSGGHMRAYAGNSYVLHLLPQGVATEEIK